MINKKNLWFLTLFSLILVLSIYYVTMPSDLLVTNNNSSDSSEVVTNIEEADVISTLKLEDDATNSEEIAKIKETLSKTDSTTEEKNTAFEQLKEINNKVAKEEMIEEKIKTELNLSAFVKVEGDQIKVVVGTSEHSASLANEIMRLVQSLYDSKMYISVQFQS